MRTTQREIIHSVKEITDVALNSTEFLIDSAFLFQECGENINLCYNGENNV